MGAVTVRMFTCDEKGCKSHCSLHPDDSKLPADALIARGWLALPRDDNDPDAASLTVYCPGCKSKYTPKVTGGVNVGH